MCGIFGIALKSGANIDSENVRNLLANLYVLSESRGKESAGLHMYYPKSGESWTLKGECSATNFMRSEHYASITKKMNTSFYDNKKDQNEPIAILAHSRLVTNGSASLSKNNQPVHWGDVTMVHNGIVVNVDELWSSHSHLKRYAQVDTEIMTAIVDSLMMRAFDPLLSTKELFSHIKGAASIAWLHGKSSVLTLATNTGDLYFIRLPDDKGIIFASERYILESATKDIFLNLYNKCSADLIEWLRPNHVLLMNIMDNQPSSIHGIIESAGEQTQNTLFFPLQRSNHHIEKIINSNHSTVVVVQVANESLLKYNEKSIANLKRCSRCILPETFPFITFDKEGVCSICQNYKPRYNHMNQVDTKKIFINSLEKYRRTNASADVLVPFSGGRDSSYGLHLIFKEFGLKPVTFTYDWGMVTDLARRNIARMCGQLGVQNILVSADIKAKRNNIRKNVSAWLKKPDLGMIPLFMAGDKHFFKVVNQLKRQTGINLDLWCANPLENTDFKSAFCGIRPDFEKKRLDYLSFGRKAKLANYYLSRFLGNPGYLNSSLVDTFGAFMSYYFEPRKDFYFIFDHFIWNENEVNQILLNDYDWETSPDSPSTWRIGDGTAPFYNYIYLTACGFSEFDTFRSNQIREGMITRKEALDSVIIENRPRTETLKWYFETIGLDFDSVIKKVNTLDVMELHK